MAERAHTINIVSRGEHGDDFEWSIECPYAGQLAGDSKPCSTYVQCQHKATDEMIEELLDVEEAPCEQAAAGWHRLLEGFPHEPTYTCWAVAYDGNSDLAWDLFHEHGPGRYLVALRSGYAELEFDVLATIPEVAQ